MKGIYLNERRKRQLLYLSLLMAAVFFAVTGHVGAWLAIAIGVGLAIDEIAYQISKFRAKRNPPEPEKANKIEAPANEEKAEKK